MTTGTIYTTQDIADALGVTPGRVRQLTGELGVGRKWGGVWMFDDADLAALRQRNTDQHRPRKSDPKSLDYRDR